MGDDYVFERVKAAMEKARQVPPEELFASLVKRGVIDEQGRLLIHMPLWANRQQRGAKTRRGREARTKARPIRLRPAR